MGPLERIWRAVCAFLAGLHEISLPIAHAEGQFAVRNESSFAEFEASGQLVLRYAPLDGFTDHYNPNGSVGDVAGMSDKSGRVLGLMPHPERFIDRTQHPQWTRKPSNSEGKGLHLFRNAVRYFS